MVRRILTEPKTALAGVMLDNSFARFRPSIAASSEERTPFCPFDRLDVSTMVETQGGCEKAVGRGGCKEEFEP